MARDRPDNYSSLQIGLHWAVALLIVFQFLGHGGMEAVWRAFSEGGTPESDEVVNAYFHAGAGLTIFVLALWRVYLRFTRGAPPLPENEPAAFKGLAHLTHFLIYLLIIGMPISGSVAWFLGVEPAANAHALASTVLFWLVVLHVLGALAQHFVLRTNVLTRMIAPGSEPR